MSIEKIREINREWEESLLDWTDNETSFWHYEPFSEGYWSEKYKIVLCNAEAYGDNRENVLMTFEKFKELIAKYEKDVPTLVRSALFLYCLYKRLYGVTVSEEKLAELSGNYDELLDGIRNTMYMNLRKEENWEGKAEDTDGIRRSLVPGKKYFDNDEDCRYNEWNRNFTLEFLEELEADIFVITSETGWDVLRRIYEGKIDLFNNLPKWGMYQAGKTLYVSMYHPSPRFMRSDKEYINYIIEKTEEIYDRLQRGT